MNIINLFELPAVSVEAFANVMSQIPKGKSQPFPIFCSSKRLMTDR